MTLILIIILVLLILNPNICTLCVISTSKAWFYRLVPILYPNLIIIDLLSNNYYIELLSFYIYKYFKKIIRLNYPTSFLIFIISIICGSPASSKLINSALEDKKIDDTEADSLIYATSNLSLPYIVYILGLFNINIFLYLFLQIIYMVIIIDITNKSSYKNINIPTKKKTRYINLFFKSINKNIDILLSILGVMIFFNILLSLLNINTNIFSFLEILNGHSILYSLEINKKLKELILVSSLSFLGISMHLQIMLVYPNIKYIKFILIRLLYSLMCIFIFLF